MKIRYYHINGARLIFLGDSNYMFFIGDSCRLKLKLFKFGGLYLTV
jgi:hypothetical protein